MTKTAACLGQAQALFVPLTVPLVACLAASALSGCAQPVRVNSLATGQPERVAYELFGHNLADLRAQASQLCPQGGEVVRAAESRQATGASQLPALRWAEDKVGRALPPAGSAQLVVTCDAPGRQLLAALPPPPPPASAPTRQPLFRLGSGDGPGMFSRLGGAVAGLWGGSAAPAPVPMPAAGDRPGSGTAASALPPAADAMAAPVAPSLSGPRDAAAPAKAGAATGTAADAAPKGKTSNAQAKNRTPVPVSGYDD